MGIMNYLWFREYISSLSPALELQWVWGVWYVVCGRKSRNGIKMSNDDEQSVVGG